MIDLSTLTLPKQLIQLRMCLSPEMLHVLRSRLNVPDDTASSVQEVLDMLEAHVKDQTNEALRRRELFSCRQAVGEKFDEYYVRVKGLADAVDVCKGQDDTCYEMQIKQVIMMGVRDEQLIQELIPNIPTLSLDEIVMQQCYAFEAARTTASVIASHEKMVCATSQYKANKKKQKPPAPPPPPKETCNNCLKTHERGKCPASGSACNNCGKQGHWARTPPCSALKATCRACGNVGHYDKCCKKSRGHGKGIATQGRTQESPRSPRRDSKGNGARLVHSAPRAQPASSPPVTITVVHSKGSSSISMLPDTGADVTIIGPGHLARLGLSPSDLQPAPADPRYTADGSPMSPALGSLHAELHLKGNATQAWIDVHEDIPMPLLSYQACKELRLIPDRFPQPIAEVTHASVCVHVQDKEAPITASQQPVSLPPTPTPALPFNDSTTPAQAKAFFLKEYKDVLMSRADLLNSPLKPMAGPPMRIHLREDAQPFAIHTPRQIPLAFQEEVKKELQSMVAQGIIAPAGDNPSPWCHPLVAVAKPKGGVRITTDLSKLNDQVSRPAHPSPTPFMAIRSVAPKSRYFTTVDALCGYWQLELAEEDQHLTTFITPYGRYQYLRGPMGFAATGDTFCLRGDAALHGISNCVKVVDDVLLYDETYLEHLQRINVVLAR